MNRLLTRLSAAQVAAFLAGAALAAIYVLRPLFRRLREAQS